MEEKKILKQGLSVIVNAFGWVLPETDLENQILEIPENVQELAKQRWKAKNDKDWPESDRLRDEIKSLGWEIKDEKGGYSLEPQSE